MPACFTCMYICVPYVPGAHKDQRSVSYPLRLKFQTVMSSYVSAGN